MCVMKVNPKSPLSSLLDTEPTAGSFFLPPALRRRTRLLFFFFPALLARNHPAFFSFFWGTAPLARLRSPLVAARLADSPFLFFFLRPEEAGGISRLFLPPSSGAAEGRRKPCGFFFFFAAEKSRARLRKDLRSYLARTKRPEDDSLFFLPLPWRRAGRPFLLSFSFFSSSSRSAADPFSFLSRKRQSGGFSQSPVSAFSPRT